MFNSRCKFVFLLLLFSTVVLGINAGLDSGFSSSSTQQNRGQASMDWNGDFVEGWRQFESLTKDQKYEAASSLLEKMLARAREAKNSAEWTRCLIHYTQLRIALHGYETAVRFLKDQPWPDDWAGSSLLNLFYAQTLTTYARNYSWEINQRERTESNGPVDLKAWTRGQIYEEAQKAFEKVWSARGRLGELPVSEWKLYVTPNSYPPGIRPTLRDAVSYLCVEMRPTPTDGGPIS